ncbi:MAG: hypothetical protein Q4D04_00010 [Clostridia bacterium]|nr:hypothetical protein [Clostridia bacterium]
MRDNVVDQCEYAEGRDPLHIDAGILGLPLDEALRRLDSASPVIEYTRSPRSDSDAGTARVVRVKSGVITAAFFNDIQGEKGV